MSASANDAPCAVLICHYPLADRMDVWTYKALRSRPIPPVEEITGEIFRTAAPAIFKFEEPVTF